MSDKTIWTPLWPEVVDGDEKWCDGTAFKHPNNTEEASTGGGKDAEPISLEAYNQIIDTYNDIAKEGDGPERDNWLEKDPLSVKEVENFKKDINEWRYPDFKWSIAPGDEDYLCEDDINDLRRMATYPDVKSEIDVNLICPIEPEYYIGYAITRSHFTGQVITAVKDGMRIFYAANNETSAGWNQFVNTKIAPEGQSHRFWLWGHGSIVLGGRSFSGGFNQVAGIIGLDGTMYPPIKAYDFWEGEWVDYPHPPEEDNKHWTFNYLIQLVQDVHTPIESLDTQKVTIKGAWWTPDYLNTQTYNSTVTGDGTWCILRRTSVIITQWGACNITHTISSASVVKCEGTNRGGGSLRPVHVPAHWVDEHIDDVFNTWEYYMDKM